MKCIACGRESIASVDGRPIVEPKEIGWSGDAGRPVCRRCRVTPAPPQPLTDVVKDLLRIVDRFVEVVERDYWLDRDLRDVAEVARSSSAVARQIAEGKRYPCFYCGAWTSMLPYITEQPVLVDGRVDYEDIVYPSCCDQPGCISRWEPLTVEEAPASLLEEANKRPKQAHPANRTDEP